MSLYLSRLRLRRDAALSALAPVLAPDDGSGRADRSHRLLWAVFSDGPDRKRDFLWREEDLGRFLVLSARAPLDPHHLFEIETKTFKPELAKGDKLRFVLRANAVVSRKTGGSRGRRDDIVMHRMHAVPKGFERAQRRDEIACEAGRDWLRNQGAKAALPSKPAMRRDIAPSRFLRKGRCRSNSACSISKGGLRSKTFPLSFRR